MLPPPLDPQVPSAGVPGPPGSTPHHHLPALSWALQKGPGILHPAAVASTENRAGVLGSVGQVPSFIKFLLHSSISQLPAAHTYPQRVGEEIFSLLKSWSFCEYLTSHRTVVWFLFFPQGFCAPDKFIEESSCLGTWILEKKKAQKNITWVSVWPLCQGPGFRAHPLSSAGGQQPGVSSRACPPGQSVARRDSQPRPGQSSPASQESGLRGRGLGWWAQSH